MSTVKQQVRRVLAQLPDDCTFEDVQYHLYIADLISRRIESSETTAGVPHAKVAKRFANAVAIHRPQLRRKAIRGRRLG